MAGSNPYKAAWRDAGGRSGFEVWKINEDRDMADVDFYVNCFERDYRQVLSEGFMQRKVRSMCRDFARVVVTINNVADRQDATRLALKAVERGEISTFLFVADALPKALEKCGLSLGSLGRVRHYIDFALVAVASAQAEFLLYCCAEVEMEQPMDWVTPAIAKLCENPLLLVANPAWASDPGGAEREALLSDGPYRVGYGFSDQIFLVRTERLRGPVFGYTHPAGQRYPMSDVGDIFEKRVDAFMRCEGLMRLTDTRVFYRHRGPEGTGYPRAAFWRRALRRIRGLGAASGFWWNRVVSPEKISPGRRRTGANPS
jgi:hypothetical protein